MKGSILAWALVASAPAFAGDAVDVGQALPRVEVHVQAVQAVRLGQDITRDEVHLQALDAVRLGQVQAGEQAEVAPVDATPVKLREEVQAELAAYMKTSEYSERNAESSR